MAVFHGFYCKRQISVLHDEKETHISALVTVKTDLNEIGFFQNFGPGIFKIIGKTPNVRDTHNVCDI